MQHPFFPLKQNYEINISAGCAHNFQFASNKVCLRPLINIYKCMQPNVCTNLQKYFFYLILFLFFNITKCIYAIAIFLFVVRSKAFLWKPLARNLNSLHSPNSQIRNSVWWEKHFAEQKLNNFYWDFCVLANSNLKDHKLLGTIRNAWLFSYGNYAKIYKCHWNGDSTRGDARCFALLLAPKQGSFCTN